MATGQACASCGQEASRETPLFVTQFGNASVKLCPPCRNSAWDGLTHDSIGTECASCGESSADAGVAEFPLIPTLGLQSTTVNLCRSCHAPVKEWHGTMAEARALEDLGVTTVLLEKKRADAIVRTHGIIADPLAAIGQAPALIAQTLNKRGYALPEQKNGWTAESAAALVQAYRVMRLGNINMKTPKPSEGAMAQGN